MNVMEVRNEMGVVVAFAQMAENRGFSIVEVSASFPDAIIETGGLQYLAEFEYKASNFFVHGHDIRKCDIIICWINDLNIEEPIPVIELSRPDWITYPIELLPRDQKEIIYWRHRALAAERSLDRVRPPSEPTKSRDEKKEEYKEQLPR